MKQLKAFMCMFTLAILGAPLLFSVGCTRRAHESDESLMKAFSEHREIFEKLRRMAAVDTNLIRLTMSYPDSKDDSGISSERLSEYRRLFRKARCSEGLMQAPARPGIRFITSSVGLLNRGSGKGYCYS